MQAKWQDKFEIFTNRENFNLKKFNILDFLIIAVIIFFILLSAAILNHGSLNINPKTVQLELLVEIAANDKFILDEIKPGEVFLSVDNLYKGIITNVDLEVTQIRVFDKALKAYKMVDSISGKYNAYITILVDATEVEDHFTIGDISLKVGSPLFIKAKEYNSKAHILEMEVLSDEIK